MPDESVFSSLLTTCSSGLLTISEASFLNACSFLSYGSFSFVLLHENGPYIKRNCGDRRLDAGGPWEGASNNPQAGWAGGGLTPAAGYPLFLLLK